MLRGTAVLFGIVAALVPVGLLAQQAADGTDLSDETLRRHRETRRRNAEARAKLEAGETTDWRELIADLNVTPMPLDSINTATGLSLAEELSDLGDPMRETPQNAILERQVAFDYQRGNTQAAAIKANATKATAFAWMLGARRDLLRRLGPDAPAAADAQRESVADIQGFVQELDGRRRAAAERLAGGAETAGPIGGIPELHRLVELERHVRAASADTRRNAPAACAFTGCPITSLDQLGLRDDEDVLLYEVTADAVYAFLLRGAQVRGHAKVGISRRDLARAVRAFTAMLQPRGAPPALAAYDGARADTLGLLLLGGLQNALDPNVRLVVVPDEILAELPFELLPVQGAPLGDRFRVQYHVALHLLSGLRALGGDARFARDLLVVADPVFNGGDPRAGGPSAGDLPRFARLPETGGLARRLAARSAGATVLSGADASTARLRSEPLAEYRRIVLATHAEASPDSPDLTTKDGKRLAEPILVLSRGLAPRDGVVSLTELGALGLRAEMVALVACETGRGRMIAGEGTVSLGRAMLGAGAQSVLVSLWRVDELASTMLVDRFFEVLYDGTTHPAEALRRARQAVRSVPGFDHPFYWAGFVLLGGATG